MRLRYRQLLAWRRDRPGQGLVEFALALPVFLLFIFGVVQVVFVYKANAALSQAATDGAHTLAVQSSDGPPQGLQSWQADTAGLRAIRAALASQDLTQIQEIDIFAGDSAGNPIVAQVGQGPDLISSPASPKIAVTLMNRYVPLQSEIPSGKPACKVDQFYMISFLDPAKFSPTCALPWNGSEYAKDSNDNGRKDQRCQETRIYVRIQYRYAATSFPVHYNVLIKSQDSTTLEPRAFRLNDPGLTVSLNCPSGLG